MRADIIHKTDENGENPLFKATVAGDLEEIKRLASQGCIYAYNSSRTTPLMIAARDGSFAIANFFLSPDYPDREIALSQINYQTTKNKYTALMFALHGSSTVIPLLLNSGADDQLTNHEGSTPFILAAGLGNLDALDILFTRNPGNLNKINHKGGSALAMAAQNGHLNCVQRLLTLGAQYCVLESGYSPLIAAITHGHYAVAAYFLSPENPTKAEVVANINSCQRSGSALLLATDTGNTELVRLLLEAGAKQLVNKDGVSPLMVAAEKRSAEITSLFLQDPDCDINQVENTLGRSALFIATVYGAHDVMSLLLGLGAKHQATRRGTTPLIQAALNNDHEAVEILLLSRPSHEVITATDMKDRSAYSIAKENGNAAIVSSLAKAGGAPPEPIPYTPALFPNVPEPYRDDKNDIELRPLMTR